MKLKFSEKKKEVADKNYAPDFLWLDAAIIENRHCPKCGAKLTYKGFSNPAEYQAFGVCEPCDFARHFWTEEVGKIGKIKFQNA